MWPELSLVYTSMAATDRLVVLAILFAVIFILFSSVRKVVLATLRRQAPKTDTLVDDLFLKLGQVWDERVIVLITLLFLVQFAQFGQRFRDISQGLLVFVLVYFATRSVAIIIEFWLAERVRRNKLANKDFNPSIFLFARHIIVAVLWIVVILLLLQNVGFNVTALIGGLGIGGLAVAFAIQNILGDLFSSISIYFDEPFKVGDFIVLSDDESGRVERVGLKSTRLRTVEGEELILSNKDLTERTIHNYTRMRKRKVIATVTLDASGISSQQISKIRTMMNEAIASVENVEKDMTVFKEISNMGYVFEYSYFVHSNSYDYYLQRNSDVLETLIAVFDKNKLAVVFADAAVVTE